MCVTTIVQRTVVVLCRTHLLVNTGENIHSRKFHEALVQHARAEGLGVLCFFFKHARAAALNKKLVF